MSKFKVFMTDPTGKQQLAIDRLMNEETATNYVNTGNKKLCAYFFWMVPAIESNVIRVDFSQGR